MVSGALRIYIFSSQLTNNYLFSSICPYRSRLVPLFVPFAYRESKVDFRMGKLSDINSRSRYFGLRESKIGAEASWRVAGERSRRRQNCPKIDFTLFAHTKQPLCFRGSKRGQKVALIGTLPYTCWRISLLK